MKLEDSTSSLKICRAFELIPASSFSLTLIVLTNVLEVLASASMLREIEFKAVLICDWVPDTVMVLPLEVSSAYAEDVVKTPLSTVRVREATDVVLRQMLREQTSDSRLFTA